MPKKIKNKQQNISINTGEPIEEKDLDFNPLAVLAVDDIEKADDDDDASLDEEDLDPFNDKWEQ